MERGHDRLKFIGDGACAASVGSVKLAFVQEPVFLEGGAGRLRNWRQMLLRAGSVAPTMPEALLAVLSAFLLVFAFPDFDLSILAWVGLVPLFAAVARRRRAAPSFLLGWITGTLFFYSSCIWLTYPMIHYGGVPVWLAYVLLIPAPLTAGLFPALCTAALARLCARAGLRALLFAPFLWAALEWARLGVIGQLWNALGYSQSFHPELIQAARFGGVYAVSFLLVAVNAALAYALLKRTSRSLVACFATIVCVALVILLSRVSAAPRATANPPSAVVVAVQPNVIPNFQRSLAETNALVRQHFAMSEQALFALDRTASEAQGGATLAASSGGMEAARLPAGLPRIVIWPESPMNFRFARDSEFREMVTGFVSRHRTSMLFNSLEPAPEDGGYNSAVLVNEEGRLVEQYDKIRLMPFGEYVPLPRWMPGTSLVRGIVGEFTPGTRYTLMPLGGANNSPVPRAGVFICLESAYPYIARRFTAEGADVLVEITNDAYQGDTAIMRQHLANAVFRAVENGRTLLRTTNTGITARINPRGEVFDETPRFRAAVRTWPVARADGGQTFYTRFGDTFVAVCAVISLLCLALASRGKFSTPKRESE